MVPPPGVHDLLQLRLDLSWHDLRGRRRGVEQVDGDLEIGLGQRRVGFDRGALGLIGIGADLVTRGGEQRQHLGAQDLAFERLEQVVELQMQRVIGLVDRAEERLAGNVGRFVADVVELRLLAADDDEAVLGQETLLLGGQAGQHLAHWPRPANRWARTIGGPAYGAGDHGVTGVW